MGTTARGLVYPDPTDPPDGPGNLQDLAESVDAAYYTGGAWITSTTGFTLASNWTALAVAYRVIGPLVFLRIAADRATSAITVAAGNGNIADVAVLSAIPSAIIPTVTVAAMPGHAGRVCSFLLTSAGAISLSACAGDGTNVLVGDGISAMFVYPLG